MEEAPPALLSLLEGYKNEISFIRKEQIVQNKEIKAKWESFSSPDYLSTNLKSYTPGDYLLNTLWGQDNGYNQYCPLQTNGVDTCLAGCGAVAIAQILHYWGCKVFPDSTISYINNSPNYSLSVDFWDQDYNWEDMDLTDADMDNAELIYQCGVAAHSNYTDSTTSTGTAKIINAMKVYFGFNDMINSKSKSNYLSTWDSLIKTEIDNGRPIFYMATDTSFNIGHVWVIDGYRTNDNKYRCNWGWGYPNPNSWYTLTGLTPEEYNFNSSHSGIFNVEPILDACSGLDGSFNVCSSNESYSVTIPTTASVVWSKSSNLDQVGGNTGTTYTVNEGYSGSGYVTATIKNSQNQTFLSRTKDVWAGIPENGLYPDCLIGPSCCEIGTNRNYFDGTPFPLYIDGAEYNWSIFPDNPGIYVYPYTSQISARVFVYNNATPGSYTLFVTASNDCGANGSAIISFTVPPLGQSCSGYSMIFSPNPTTGVTTLSIESTNEEMTFDGTTEWELEVYSQSQLLKTKQTNLRGNSTIIQTAGWQEGVYVVRVNYKDEILTGKLVVKK